MKSTQTPSRAAWRRAAWSGALALVLAGCASAAPMPRSVISVQELQAMQEQGRLAEATIAAQQALAGDGVSTEQRRALEFEIERARRIRRDYSHTAETLFAALRKRLPDLTQEEFLRWVGEGRFDAKQIDGEQRFVGSSVANLFFRYPDAAARRVVEEDFRYEEFVAAHVASAQKEVAALPGAALLGQPRRLRLRMTITVEPGTVEPGSTVRCWMPFPQQVPSQTGLELLGTEPAVLWINGPEYPVRSLYFEAPAGQDGGARFTATYTLSTHPRRVAVDPALVEAARPSLPADVLAFTREQEHIEFTPALRELSASIVGNETNPARRARLLFDWLSTNIKYSYAREYSTLTNISDYVLANRYGDCGQITLFYIALCRLNGIPARWQSGWVLYPMHTNLHDWCEIYLPPYGWVPVDPNYSIDIPRDFTNLPLPEREELRSFYFGGMDAYRLIVNREHAFPHYPPKQDFRSDTVDFQRGELEANGRNLYFNEFDYRLEVEYLDAEGAAHAKPPERPLLKPGMTR